MKITICGSTRFKREWLFWNALLTSQGHVVYSVAMWSHGPAVEQPSQDLKGMLDVVHLQKITASDAVFVINRYEFALNDPSKIDPSTRLYVGESTTREIQFAEVNQKPVMYVSDIDEVQGVLFRAYPRFIKEVCDVFKIKPEMVGLRT